MRAASGPDFDANVGTVALVAPKVRTLEPMHVRGDGVAAVAELTDRAKLECQGRAYVLCQRDLQAASQLDPDSVNLPEYRQLAEIIREALSSDQDELRAKPGPYVPRK